MNKGEYDESKKYFTRSIKKHLKEGKYSINENSNEELKPEDFFSNLKIIQIMKDIVYTPPYPILFGRISLTELKPKEKINRNQKEINELFYEGLDLEEFKYDKRS